MNISWTYIEVNPVVLPNPCKVVWIVEKTVAIELKYIDIRNMNYAAFFIKVKEIYKTNPFFDVLFTNH